MNNEKEPLTVQMLSDILLKLISENKGHYTVETDATELHGYYLDDIYKYIDLY